MKALSFLEWCIQNTSKAYGSLAHYELYCEVLNLYNQPFSVDMLVNPIESHPVFDKRESNYIKYESQRLFDGWRINKSEYARNVNGNIYSMEEGYTGKVVYQDNNKFYINTGYSFDIDGHEYYYGLEFHTLNDFITLCNLAGIELQFNKSNETIKKLFGKDKK